MKKVFVLIIAAALLYACSNGSDNNNASAKSDADATTAATENPSYDPHRGEGKFTNVEVADKLDATMADAGKKIYDVKCSACHKLTSEKLVGPGWQGVTKRRQPDWILNMITNVDMMLESDPEAQRLLQECIVRMPNQNLKLEKARQVLEFQRSNDGEK